ncbi:MAG TPA: ribonuclease P protein component [Acidimicrobiales bacterium]|nr:ribonuclease P protein component [Acidimicrobiales bacterium]
MREHSGPITITFVAAADGTPPRVAYAIGRRVGPAVVRNRLRRQLRAIVAELAPTLHPGMYLIGATPAAPPLSYRELRQVVVRAAAAVAQHEVRRQRNPGRSTAAAS